MGARVEMEMCMCVCRSVRGRVEVSGQQKTNSSHTPNLEANHTLALSVISTCLSIFVPTVHISLNKRKIGLTSYGCVPSSCVYNRSRRHIHKIIRNKDWLIVSFLC